MPSSIAALNRLYCLNTGEWPPKSRQTGLFFPLHMCWAREHLESFKSCASAPCVWKGTHVWYFGGALLPSLSESRCYRFRINSEKFAILSKNEENSVFWCIGWTLWLSLQLNYPSPPIGRWTDANPRDSEAPKSNNIVFFHVRSIFVFVERFTCTAVTSLSAVPGTDACVVI